jgi:hypothetical protein
LEGPCFRLTTTTQAAQAHALQSSNPLETEQPGKTGLANMKKASMCVE